MCVAHDDNTAVLWDAETHNWSGIPQWEFFENRVEELLNFGSWQDGLSRWDGRPRFQQALHQLRAVSKITLFS